jgi:hypothetical protein
MEDSISDSYYLKNNITSTGFSCLNIEWYRKDYVKVAICNQEQQLVELVTMTKDKMKKPSKNSSEKEITKESDSKEKLVCDFVKHFDTIDKPFSTYVFPHFAGDIALLQVFVNPLQNEKKRKFLGIFKRKSKDKLLEEFKESDADDF